MATLIVIGSLIVLAIMILAALEFNNIAHLKGYSGGKYGWWSIIFPLAGYLMVIALPDRNGAPGARTPSSAAKPTVEKDELPDL